MGIEGSNFSKIFHQRLHKERYQPERRAKKGELKKRSDFLRKARRFKKVKSIVNNLHEKIADSNPNYYDPKMVSYQKLRDGRIRKKIRTQDVSESSKILNKLTAAKNMINHSQTLKDWYKDGSIAEAKMTRKLFNEEGSVKNYEETTIFYENDSVSLEQNLLLDTLDNKQVSALSRIRRVGIQNVDGRYLLKEGRKK